MEGGAQSSECSNVGCGYSNDLMDFTTTAVVIKNYRGFLLLWCDFTSVPLFLFALYIISTFYLEGWNSVALLRTTMQGPADAALFQRNQHTNTKSVSFTSPLAPCCDEGSLSLHPYYQKKEVGASSCLHHSDPDSCGTFCEENGTDVRGEGVRERKDMILVYGDVGVCVCGGGLHPKEQPGLLLQAVVGINWSSQSGSQLSLVCFYLPFRCGGMGEGRYEMCFTRGSLGLTVYPMSRM